MSNNNPPKSTPSDKKIEEAKPAKYIPDYAGNLSKWEFGQNVEFLRRTKGKIVGYIHELDKKSIYHELTLVVTDEKGEAWTVKSDDLMEIKT